MTKTVKPGTVVDTCVWRPLWERSMERRPLDSDKSGIPGHSFTCLRSALILYLHQSVKNHECNTESHTTIQTKMLKCRSILRRYHTRVRSLSTSQLVKRIPFAQVVQSSKPVYAFCRPKLRPQICPIVCLDQCSSIGTSSQACKSYYAESDCEKKKKKVSYAMLLEKFS